MNDKNLDRLLTYTTFHIGIYISLVAAIIGAGIFGKLNSPHLDSGVIFFVLAGACGGVTGTNIPRHNPAPNGATVAEQAGTFDFFSAKLGFAGIRLATYKCWVFAEHTFFWIGVACLLRYYFFDVHP